MKILLGSPVHQSAPILKEFLRSISELQLPEECRLDLHLIDDGCEPDAASLLRDAYQRVLTGPPREASNVRIEKNQSPRTPYVANETTHYWNEDLVWRVAAMKDVILARGLMEDYDAVFLVDSDLVLHPNTIKVLWDADKDVISEVFWTRWQPTADELPQVWLDDTYTLYSRRRGETPDEAEVNHRTWAFLRMLRVPGVYPVGGLGACTLIRRRALDKVSFAPISNLSFWGEDRHFCVRAAANGVELWADTHHPSLHLYRPSDLERVEAFRRGEEAPSKMSLTLPVEMARATVVAPTPDALTAPNKLETSSRFFRTGDVHTDEMVYAFPSTWWSRRYEYAWAASFAGPDLTVLDAACGILHPFKFYLNKTCRETFACDRDPLILDKDAILNNIISEIGVEAITHEGGGVSHESFEGLKLACTDITKLPYEDERFDRVFCISVLEHMDAATMTASLSEMCRTLKKDGLIVLTFDFPTIDVPQIILAVKTAGLAFAGELDARLPDDAIYSDLWGRLYCFRTLLKRADA